MDESAPVAPASRRQKGPMSLFVRLLVSSALLAAAVPASAQVTTESRRLAVKRTECVLIPHTEPLRVPEHEVCGCVKLPKLPDGSDGGIGDCARPQDELTRLVDHDTTVRLIAYLELLATKAGIAESKPY